MTYTRLSKYMLCVSTAQGGKLASMRHDLRLISWRPLGGLPTYPEELVTSELKEINH